MSGRRWRPRRFSASVWTGGRFALACDGKQRLFHGGNLLVQSQLLFLDIFSSFFVSLLHTLILHFNMFLFNISFFLFSFWFLLPISLLIILFRDDFQHYFRHTGLFTGSHHDQQGFVFYFVLVSLILISSAFGHRFLPFFVSRKTFFIGPSSLIYCVVFMDILFKELYLKIDELRCSGL